MTPETEARLCVLIEHAIEGNKRIEAKIDDLAQRLSRVEGRIEEQSKFLQLVIGNKMSRKTAA